MIVVDLAKRAPFSINGPTKDEVVVTDHFKFLLIRFESGQEVAPCVMARSTGFLVLEGMIKVVDEGEDSIVSAGSLVLVPAHHTRQIVALSRSSVAAMQYE